MSLCDIFPDDPSCQAPEPEPQPEPEEPEEEDPEEEEGGEEEGGEEEEAEPEGEVTETEKRVFDAILEVTKWSHLKQLSMFAGLSPFMSNLGYTMVAGAMAGGYAMDAFRYRSASDYYDGAKSDNMTNWWKTSDMIRLYGGVALGGTLFVTSLLATFGIAVPLNGLIWMLGGGLGGMILSAIVAVMRFLGVEAAVSTYKKQDSDLSAASTMWAAIRADQTYDMAKDAAGMVALATAAEGWYFNLWNYASDEERMTNIAEWEETVATRAQEYAEANPEGQKKEGGEEEAEEGEGEEGEEGEEGAEGEEGEEGEEGAEDE